MRLLCFSLLFCAGLYVIAQTEDVQLTNALSKSDELTYSKPDSAIYHARKAINRAKQLESEDGLAGGLQRIGRAFQVLGQYDSSKHYSLEALGLWEEIDNDLQEAEILNNIGIVYDE